MKRLLLTLTVVGLVTGWGNERAAAQQSLSFTNFSLESGTALQAGAVYRFTSVATGWDALVEIEGLVNGATLVQIDDVSPSSAQLQPTLNGTPNLNPQADFSILLVASGTSTPGAVSGLEISAIDVDGAAGRREFVILSGIQSYTVEGLLASTPKGPSELTISADPLGTRILGPEVTYGGIDSTITQVIAVASAGSSSRIEFSIGQTGTGTAAGERLYSLEHRVGQINTFDDPVTTNLAAQIGAALAAGTITDNGDGSYNIPLTFALEGFGDVPLFDLQITSDLALAFGTYVSSGPLAAGQYTVDDPVVGTLTGGAVIAGASGNTSFDGSTDKSLLNVVSGNKLPVGATAEISFNVTWYPTGGTTSTTVQGAGHGDYAESGASDDDTTDLSHAGSDPDPNSNGPSDNMDATSIDVSGLPVELADFRVVRDGRKVSLSWVTYSEIDNAGFDVEHRSPVSANDDFRTVGFVAGMGTSDVANGYRFDVGKLIPGTHTFRLHQIDVDGSSSYSEVLSVDVELAERFELAGAYPNPFNPVTTIRFSLREAGPVALSVYDVTGREVRSLASGRFEAGTHEARFEAGDLPSGLYVYRIVTEGGTAAAPVVLLK